ncbi:MAG: hypothetical protein EBU46_06075 [Nitrosomonadaceae bacterium]|nr:hypothetical protein [Nitrosomonadaceae bacterium]
MACVPIVDQNQINMMKPVTFQFQRFKNKLPPIGKPLLVTDIAGSLWAGTFHGRKRIYDFDAGRSTNRKGYSMDIHMINGLVGSYFTVVEPGDFDSWAVVPARI